MFDLLVSADALVPDVQGTAERLGHALDLPALQRSWVQEDKDWQFRVYWLRSQSDRASAASLLEIIGPHPESGWHSTLRHAFDAQGARPMKTHATVVSVSDMPSHLARLDAAGIPYRYSPSSEFMPFDRLWIGQSGDESQGEISYDPKFDNGMWIELLSSEPLPGLPHMEVPQIAKAKAAVAAADAHADGFLRVVSRTFLVPHLEAAVETLERTLDWRPSSSYADPASGDRIAAYGGMTPGGAQLEMMQPGPGAEADAHMAQFGPGAYRITFGVGDVRARSARLEKKGVPFRPLSGNGKERLRIDPAALNGLIVELINVR